MVQCTVEIHAKFEDAGIVSGPRQIQMTFELFMRAHDIRCLNTAREVGVECCVAQSLDASPIQHKATQQTTHGSTIMLQEPRPGSQSMMQAHNSQQLLEQREGRHLQP